MNPPRLPITVRQWPRWWHQALVRSALLRRPLGRPPTFRLCYFSCHSYFRYLMCALHSLRQSAPAVRFEVYVFNDSDMPLSAAQIDALRQLIPGLRVIPWPKSMGWGAEQIANIWGAYALAAEGAADDDIVARVDSDVFFFNDTIFQAVSRSSADLVGDGHYVDFRYCQGGCYFLRAGAVRKVVSMLERHPVASLAHELDEVVEDIAAWHFARRAGLSTWLTWFMMFPDELRNAGGLTRWQRWKFSCAHFVMKNKAVMLETYEREMLDPASVPAFRAMLEVA